MLQINNLTATVRRDLRSVIESFSFVLGERDKVVIIGEEGNGKSTLLKLIYNPDLVSDYIEWSGEIIRRGTRLGYLPQEMTVAEKALAVSDYFAAVDGFYDTEPRDIAAWSRDFGFQKDFVYTEQSISTLSGGERVKMQFLRLLIENPDVFLLDEPTNDIDIETLEWLERFINELNKPVMFVSHDETLIENTATVIIHLELVRRKTVPRATVAKLSYREYIDRRTRAFDYQEQQARAEKAEYDAKMERYRQIYQRVDHEQDTLTRQDPHSGRLLKKKMHSVKALEHRFEREAENMTEMPDTEEAIFLKFEETVRIPNGKTVVDFFLKELTIENRVLAKNIALKVTGAEKVCITGRNGSGKTSMIRIIAAELLNRTDIKCGYMPQNYFDLLPQDLTPVDYLAPSGHKTDVTRVMTFLGSVKYTSQEMSHCIDALSGGQKAKLMFLKMILDGCNVLVLDEPTRNFSPLSNPVIRGILKSYGGAIIAVSHDRKFIEEVCTRVITLDAFV